MQPWRRTDWTLRDRTAQAWTLGHKPRHSRQIDAACGRHIARFPHKLVGIELDTAALLSLRALLHHSRRFGRPHRGNRADHWTTRAIMDTNNQLARLDRIKGRNAA
ncbi:hypothetical protein [Paracoccus aeridis]|uniref:hypothetical protein n=1 Tax=Paracoccus aeridis TaxID=1966466 RepID=UPI0010AA2644|nr:hypothetical protein [Paracoccus aeridis]